MNVGKEIASHFMTLKYEFNGNRLINRSLLPVKWVMTAQLTAVQYDEKFDVEKANLAYNKLLYWLDYATSDVVCLEGGDEIALDIALSIDNTMMFYPSEPDDGTMAEMLHAKMSAILKDDLYVGDVTVSGEDSLASYTFSLQKGGYTLPKKTDAYMEVEVAHDIPWWFRSDGYVSEFFMAEGIDEAELLVQIAENDPLMYFDELIKEQKKKEKGPAKIIEVDKWHPRKV